MYRNKCAEVSKTDGELSEDYQRNFSSFLTLYYGSLMGGILNPNLHSQNAELIFRGSANWYGFGEEERGNAISGPVFLLFSSFIRNPILLG